MNRRHALLAAPSLLLFGCATTPANGAVTLDTAKMWLSDLAGALVAASAAYTGPNAAQVQALAAQLQTAAADFANLGDLSTARSAALSILALAQQLSPMVAPFFGPAAPYVPIAIAVIQAFVSALPAPAGTPTLPPAALHRFATVGR